jgi:hypothetical protein
MVQPVARHALTGQLGWVKSAVSAAVVALLPIVITCALLWVVLARTVFDFTPSNSDEVQYWHEALTFSQAGFNGGYYTRNEVVAQLSVFHFGPHGPAFAILQGTFGRLFGWEDYSGVLFNFVLVTVALIVFLYVARLPLPSLLLLGGMLAVYWPLLLLLPTNMQEPTHHAIAITLAALLWPLFYCRASSGRRRWLVVAAFVVLSALLRPTWALLLIPLALLATWRQSWPRVTAALAGAALGIVGVGTAFVLSAAPPFEKSFVARLPAAIAESPLHGVELVGQQVATNVRHIARAATDPEATDPDKVFERLVHTERLQLGLALAAAVALILASARRTAQLPDARSAALRQGLFHLSNLGLIVFAQLALYDFYGGRDYRITSPHLLLSALLMLGVLPGRVLGIGLIGLSLLVAPPFVDVYRHYRSYNFDQEDSARETFRHAIRDVVAYDERADGWCNTLIMAGHSTVLAGAPAGIGISTMGADMPLPPKSLYVLLSTETDSTLASRLRVEPLAATPIGTVFRNLDASC